METAMSTSVAVASSPGRVANVPPRQGQTRRRSASQVVLSRKSSVCAPLKLPRSMDVLGLDLTEDASPIHALASLRFLVLSYLADLEHRLTQFEFEFDFDFDLDLDFESKSKSLEAWKLHGEHKFQEAKDRARTGIEMLKRIRVDVCSHFPELPMSFVDLRHSPMEGLASFKFRLPDVSTMSMPDVPTLNEMRSNLPDIRSHLPEIPDMTLPETVRAHLPDMNIMPSLPDLHIRDIHTGMDDVLSDMRHKFNEIDFRKPFNYIPTLSEHLDNLQYHLSGMSDMDIQVPDFSFEFTPNTVLSNLLDSLMNSDIVKEILDSAPEVIEESEDMLERAVMEVTEALKRSLHGMKLINYSDLPHPWRNNPFITCGYRFIPLNQWPLIVKSLFAWHNETLNIHTHLLPLLFWSANLLPLSTSTPFIYDTPERLFMLFAVLCLLCSSVWHTMSGCANRRSVEFCARVDYVGIGWLISASVATVVHYGFTCHPNTGMAFLCLCFSTGVAGNIFPFVKWFDQFEYRLYRIAFFVSLAFAGIGPVIALSFLHSTRDAVSFISPIFPSLTSYVVGLCFYATHFPERMLSDDVRRTLDMYGGSSHAIWHCFIVLAVYQHKSAMASMRSGLQCVL